MSKVVVMAILCTALLALALRLLYYVFDYTCVVNYAVLPLPGVVRLMCYFALGWSWF
jgi:hypothetical protein